VPQIRPDWAALYSKHGDVMHRVAATVLRGAGLVDQAGDAVQDAMVSLMASPLDDVRNWEAVMVATAKRRALDRLGSAVVRHAGPELSKEHDCTDGGDVSEEVAESLDHQRAAASVRNNLAVLDDRHRKVAWEYVALERPRAEVAAELGVTPARVSQMVKPALKQLRDAMRREEVCI
jgi:RNA polymerase sigma factor (sigma-70 family)